MSAASLGEDQNGNFASVSSCSHQGRMGPIRSFRAYAYATNYAKLIMGGPKKSQGRRASRDKGIHETATLAHARACRPHTPGNIFHHLPCLIVATDDGLAAPALFGPCSPADRPCSPADHAHSFLTDINRSRACGHTRQKRSTMMRTEIAPIANNSDPGLSAKCSSMLPGCTSNWSMPRCTHIAHKTASDSHSETLIADALQSVFRCTQCSIALHDHDAGTLVLVTEPLS